MSEEHIKNIHELEFWSFIETMKACERNGVKWKPKVGARGIRWAADRIEELETSEKKLMLALDHWASTARMLSQRVEELVKKDE